MGTVISVLIIIVCILLVLIVLVQNSKGGGLSSAFASSNQVMGVRKTGDFLEKTTWGLAIALLALCLLSSTFSSPSGAVEEATTTESVTKKKAETAPIAPPAGMENSGAPSIPSMGDSIK